MTQIFDRTFEMIKDRDASISIDNVFVAKCIFDNCSFSNETIEARRSVIKNAIVERCNFIGCQIGPGMFLDCHLTDSKATDLIIFWGTIFCNVVLSGHIPGLKINTKITLIPDTNMQEKYDRHRLQFYSEIDHAIDISNARFPSFEAKGIPARLVKLDGATQGVVRRENFNDFSRLSNLETNAWYSWLRSFAHNDEPDLILVAPLSKPKTVRDRFIAGLAELRGKGIADPA